MSANATLLDQPVYWLFGLPFDAVGLKRAIERIDSAIASREALIFATPNVNFVALAARSDAFKRNVLNTNLSLVDGMPLVWIGRLLGIPFPERVAGSSLVERLLHGDNGPTVRVFFFGGDGSSAEAAAQRVSEANGRLQAVGVLNPGFGSVDEMSADKTIDEINMATPDFLLVALGAEKGHAWIERNRTRLSVPVISHLGATINFLADTVRRAPSIWQRLGLEWVWRIFQEPRLVSRYAQDGLFLVRELALVVVPALVSRVFGPRQPAVLDCVPDPSNPSKLELKGELVEATLPLLDRALCDRLDGVTRAVLLDLSGLTSIDSRAAGYLYQLRYRSSQSSSVRLVGGGRRLARLVHRLRAGVLLE